VASDDSVMGYTLDKVALIARAAEALARLAKRDADLIAAAGGLHPLDPSPAGTFSLATITVNQYGQVEAASSGAEAQTLQGAYDLGSAGPQVIDLDGTRLGVLFRDAATPLGTVLLGVQDSPGTTEYFGVYADRIQLGSLELTGPGVQDSTPLCWRGHSYTGGADRTHDWTADAYVPSATPVNSYWRLQLAYDGGAPETELLVGVQDSDPKGLIMGPPHHTTITLPEAGAGDPGWDLHVAPGKMGAGGSADGVLYLDGVTELDAENCMEGPVVRGSLVNTTPATAIVPMQISPAFRFQGREWVTGADQESAVYLDGGPSVLFGPLAHGYIASLRLSARIGGVEGDPTTPAFELGLTTGGECGFFGLQGTTIVSGKVAVTGNGGDLLVQGGPSYAGGSTAGNVVIRGGNGPTDGYVAIGDFYSTKVEIGASGKTTYVRGALTVDEVLTLHETGGANLAVGAIADGQYLVRSGTDITSAALSSGSWTHDSLSGLPGTDAHTQYALLAGRSGGQTLKGGTAATDDLTLQSTSGAGAGGSYIYLKTGNNGAVTAVTISDAGDVSLSNTLTLAATTSSTTGVIYKGANRFLHNYKPAANDGYNVFLGENAGNFTMGGATSYNGSYNFGIGTDALQALTTGSYNVAIGATAMKLSQTAANCIAIGSSALYNDLSGQSDIAIGRLAMLTCTAGWENVAVGYSALYSLATTHYNTAIGTSAGYSCTGSSSVFIGYKAGYSETSGSRLYISNSNTTTPLIYGNFTTGTLKFHSVGGATADTSVVTLENLSNAAAMTDTRTNILFNQWYYDAVTPAVADAAKITVGTEGNWTSTASTQDAYMAFSVAVDGAVTECGRFVSGGWLSLNHSTTPQVALLLDIAAPAASGAEVLRNSHIIDLRGKMHDAYDAQHYGDWTLQAQPVTGGTGHANLVFALAIDGGGASELVKFGYAGGLGVFGHAAPTSQPATPSGTDSEKITAIIGVLQGAGLCA
jgi:hypothetical protein